MRFRISRRSIPQTTYRQPVVLVSCSDVDFSTDDPVGFYNRIFNEPGYNEGRGLGCVADYFRDQSGGRLNLEFDIYGPVKIELSAFTEKGINYGYKIQRAAVEKLCETETTDFSIYDWDGNGEVDQVIFIIAGYTGNQMSGYLWPRTGWS